MLGRRGRAVAHRDPVEQERRGERPEQEVLERRLDRAAAERERREHVEREREHLDREEHHDQVGRGDEQRHAAEREQQQRVELVAPQARPARSSGTRGRRRTPRCHRARACDHREPVDADHAPIAIPPAGPRARGRGRGRGEHGEREQREGRLRRSPRRRPRRAASRAPRRTGSAPAGSGRSSTRGAWITAPPPPPHAAATGVSTGSPTCTVRMRSDTCSDVGRIRSSTGAGCRPIHSIAATIGTTIAPSRHDRSGSDPHAPSGDPGTCAGTTRACRPRTGPRPRSRSTRAPGRPRTCRAAPGTRPRSC